MPRPGSVWKAFTNETAKQKWFAGPSGKCGPVERYMDVREGGRERAKGRWKSGIVSAFDAIYHNVVPHERLVYCYVMDWTIRRYPSRWPPCSSRAKAEQRGSWWTSKPPHPASVWLGPCRATLMSPEARLAT